MDTELTQLDKEVLERVRQNRDKHIADKEKKKVAAKAKEHIEVNTLSDKKPMHRGTTSPDILIDTNGDTLLKWTRYIIHDNTKDRKARMVNIPKQISFDGCVEVCYNTKSRVLTIIPQESNSEAK